MAPAIQSSLKLYEEILRLGFKIFLLTGRSEGQKIVTMENLKKVAFGDREKLILRYISMLVFLLSETILVLLYLRSSS